MSGYDKSIYVQPNLISVPWTPVYNLKFLSKVIEKVAAMRLTNYLCDNDLNESLQFAYKKRHSCETAFLRVENDVLKSIDNKQCVVPLLLDLSAAFDTVNHKILLHRLRSRLVVNKFKSNWRPFFLSDFTNNNNNNNNNNFISLALLSYVQGALRSCKQHCW